MQEADWHSPCKSALFWDLTAFVKQLQDLPNARKIGSCAVMSGSCLSKGTGMAHSPNSRGCPFVPGLPAGGGSRKQAPRPAPYALPGVGSGYGAEAHADSNRPAAMAPGTGGHVRF